MRKYVIMGVQGSGKGTQSSMLADLDIVHISVGDLFRWHVAQHTKLGGQVRQLMAEGSLVPEEITRSVVRDRLDSHDWNYGFVLDGYPRDRAQAEFFLANYDIDAVIHLELPDGEVRRRVEERRRAAQCDACGGPVVARVVHVGVALRQLTGRFPWRTGRRFNPSDRRVARLRLAEKPG